MKIDFYILILTLLALTACSDKPNDEPSDLVSLDLLTPVIVAQSDSRAKPIEGTFFPYLNTTTYTKLPNTNYYTDYNISFFICNKGTFIPHLNGSYNRLTSLRNYYSYTLDLFSFSWTNGTPQARIGHGIDIYAYYPHIDKTFEPNSVPFTTSQQIDWMWADPVRIYNVTTDNKTVPLKFHHAMTCIEVRLSTLYTSSIDLFSITLKDTQSKLVDTGTFDITNGKIGNVAYRPHIVIKGSGGGERLPVHQSDNSSYRSFCFLMPEKEFNQDDLKLTFVYDRHYINNIWTEASSRSDFTIPTTFKDSSGNDVTVTKFETGKRYILNLLIDNTDLIVPLSFVTDDWVTNDVNLKI